MEVILLEDVKSLGKKGQIVKINDGYARNFVLPKKLGLEATPKNLNDLRLQKAREAKEAAEELQAAKELAVKVEEKPVRLTMKTGEAGREIPKQIRCRKHFRGEMCILYAGGL